MNSIRTVCYRLQVFTVEPYVMGPTIKIWIINHVKKKFTRTMSLNINSWFLNIFQIFATIQTSVSFKSPQGLLYALFAKSEPFNLLRRPKTTLGSNLETWFLMNREKIAKNWWRPFIIHNAKRHSRCPSSPSIFLQIGMPPNHEKSQSSITPTHWSNAKNHQIMAFFEMSSRSLVLCNCPYHRKPCLCF